MTLADFFGRIQMADDGAKRLWIAAGAVLLMTAVIALWLMFFNPFGASHAAVESDQFSFGASFRGLTASTAETLQGLFGSLGRTLTAPKQYLITPTP